MVSTEALNTVVSTGGLNTGASSTEISLDSKLQSTEYKGFEYKRSSQALPLEKVGIVHAEQTRTYPEC